MRKVEEKVLCDVCGVSGENTSAWLVGNNIDVCLDCAIRAEAMCDTYARGKPTLLLEVLRLLMKRKRPSGRGKAEDDLRVEGFDKARR